MTEHVLLRIYPRLLWVDGRPVFAHASLDGVEPDAAALRGERKGEQMVKLVQNRCAL